MTFQKVVEILSEAAFARSFTTNEDWYNALKIALILTQSAALLEKQYQLLLAGGTLEAE